MKTVYARMSTERMEAASEALWGMMQTPYLCAYSRIFGKVRNRTWEVMKTCEFMYLLETIRRETA